jgi:membrane protease YdiL (CAAX protease family)
MAVAALAPCLSAPVWEEVIYRAFLLHVLSQRLPIGAAILVSSLLFAGAIGCKLVFVPARVLGSCTSV